MPKAPEEFWISQFDTAGNMPALWFQKAADLRTAADVLRNSTSSPSQWTTRLSVVVVRAMLLAMATECLLKAQWLKYGCTLANDGSFHQVLKKSDHKLNLLADAVSQKGTIKFTAQEIRLLARASLWITSGRYPIPNHFANNPARLEGWTGDPVVELEMLIQRLKRN